MKFQCISNQGKVKIYGIPGPVSSTWGRRLSLSKIFPKTRPEYPVNFDPSLFWLSIGMVGAQLVMGVFWIMTDQPMRRIVYPDINGHQADRTKNTDGVEECTISEVPSGWKNEKCRRKFRESRVESVTIRVKIAMISCCSKNEIRSRF